jgi:hypothetical protein
MNEDPSSLDRCNQPFETKERCSSSCNKESLNFRGKEFTLFDLKFFRKIGI